LLCVLACHAGISTCLVPLPCDTGTHTPWEHPAPLLGGASGHESGHTYVGLRGGVAHPYLLRAGAMHPGYMLVLVGAGHMGLGTYTMSMHVHKYIWPRGAQHHGQQVSTVLALT